MFLLLPRACSSVFQPFTAFQPFTKTPLIAQRATPQFAPEEPQIKQEDEALYSAQEA